MSRGSAGAGTGCLVWFLLFAVCSSMMAPVALFAGSLSSALGADFVAKMMEPFLCPENSTAEVITFATTSTDEYGNSMPSTGYETQCVDAQGDVTREPGPAFGFYWTGLLVIVSLAMAALLAWGLSAWIMGMIRRKVARTRSEASG